MQATLSVLQATLSLLQATLSVLKAALTVLQARVEGKPKFHQSVHTVNVVLNVDWVFCVLFMVVIGFINYYLLVF